MWSQQREKISEKRKKNKQNTKHQPNNDNNNKIRILCSYASTFFIPLAQALFYFSI